MARKFFKQLLLYALKYNLSIDFIGKVQKVKPSAPFENL
jgi:hypothetical protein